LDAGGALGICWKNWLACTDRLENRQADEKKKYMFMDVILIESSFAVQ